MAPCVLDEIISLLVSKEMITEIMKPQAAYSHEAIRKIIEDVTQSSAMRLDSTSMSKLWDLITMVYKWQMTISHEVIKVTLRHLYEIETYVTNEETHLQLHKVQNLVDNFNKLFTQDDKFAVREDILYWLKQYNVRVSLLLRMGLQSMSGNFIINSLNPMAQEMLKNIGENIYAVTQNGKVLDERRASVKSEPEVNDMQLFVDQIKARKWSATSLDGGGKVLRLSINEPNAVSVKERKRLMSFDSIDVQVDSGNLQHLMKDLTVKESQEKASLKDDLLTMLGKE